MKYGALEDEFAQKEIKKLFKDFNIKRIIETGTYFGWSTRFLSEFNVPVDTIEVLYENYSVARKNLQNFENVSLYLGNSPILLNNIINYEEENLLFFLDAHWENYWPLKDELKIIKEKNIKPVICIHDFFVPGGDKIIYNKQFVKVSNGLGSKFGYDEYDGIPLNFDFIKEELEQIYNGQYDYHYTSKIQKVDSGIIYIYPKK